MPSFINLTGNAITVIISGVLQILIICWVYDTFKRTKQMIQSQDYTNQRIYEIENKLEDIAAQQARIEQQLMERNQKDTAADETHIE